MIPPAFLPLLQPSATQHFHSESPAEHHGAEQYLGLEDKGHTRWARENTVKMLSEGFITSIRAQPKATNTAIAKDVGIYLHELHPTPTIRSSFKKSSTLPNALAVSSTHIFAPQAEKAVVHVYSREKGNQESLISFPERVHSATLVGNGVLVLGTGEGRVILWEVSVSKKCSKSQCLIQQVNTGRQISTPPAHLQAVTCLAATELHLATGSEDSNINIWSLPQLLYLNSNEVHEPIRTLSNHRASITALRMGSSASSLNICVSASKDNTIIVWNYHSGALLRTFLLPSTPLCLALDPCDRGVYIGFEDGSLQLIEFIRSSSAVNELYDTTLQSTPVQITSAPWIASSVVGAAYSLGLSYDGTSLISGHESGKIIQWNTSRGGLSAEIADLNAPVTNLVMLSPFPTKRSTKASTVVKPKIGEGNYTFTAQLTGTIGTNSFYQALQHTGIQSDMLEDAISRIYQRTAVSSGGDEKLRMENEELWAIINEQRALQKQTWEKYSKLKSEAI
jgi:pre-rRNA-processing protein IPI3